MTEPHQVYLITGAQIIQYEQTAAELRRQLDAAREQVAAYEAHWGTLYARRSSGL